MRWHGWAWTGAKWRWCCEADSLERCARELSRHARRLRVKDSHCVMTGGGSPSFTPREATCPAKAK
jgi:hypothetical protein